MYSNVVTTAPSASMAESSAGPRTSNSGKVTSCVSVSIPVASRNSRTICSAASPEAVPVRRPPISSVLRRSTMSLSRSPLASVGRLGSSASPSPASPSPLSPSSTSGPASVTSPSSGALSGPESPASPSSEASGSEPDPLQAKARLAVARTAVTMTARARFLMTTPWPDPGSQSGGTRSPPFADSRQAGSRSKRRALTCGPGALGNRRPSRRAPRARDLGGGESVLLPHFEAHLGGTGRGA